MAHPASVRCSGKPLAPLFTTFLFCLTLPPGFAVEVRRSLSVAVRLASTSSALNTGIPTNQEISEKWDQMDEFLRIMFTIACKWKHGKDIHGESVEKLQGTPGAKASDMAGIKAGLQQDSLKELKASCGMIVAKGQKRCRQSCADRWNEAMKERSECDDQCVSVYTKFESRCVGKSEDLEKLYAVKQKMADSRNRCYMGYCGKYPSVWMKESEADMQSAVSAACDAKCTAEQITKRCENKWALEADFHRAAVRSQCQGESAVSKCFEGKKGTASSEHETCASNGKATCDSQYADCQAKGKTDSTFKEAEGFCADRKKLCNEQVDARCLKEHDAALNDAKAACESGADAEFKTCEDTKLKDLGTASVTECEGKLGKTCPEDCASQCKVPEMAKCLQDLSGTDPAEAFCDDFWRLLHESSEVDPMTGNPIVLLAH
eukprot:CAMPEP_0170242996 /NCGR_PEP_ID=MMETSP0116_2-20130129/21271_1 /TAXON_ID=400756 /ORGANISM="Durinskia baltica, Strain CSIRO CS-38" /LENGTH=432 /DNA_ID=CAMNT_0010493845 /DNA_START=44 /DNA_END=1342 /DNA_ORIENTATION=+